MGYNIWQREPEQEQMDAVFVTHFIGGKIYRKKKCVVIWLKMEKKVLEENVFLKLYCIELNNSLNPFLHLL